MYSISNVFPLGWRGQGRGQCMRHHSAQCHILADNTHAKESIIIHFFKEFFLAIQISDVENLSWISVKGIHPLGSFLLGSRQTFHLAHSMGTIGLVKGQNFLRDICYFCVRYLLSLSKIFVIFVWYMFTTLVQGVGLHPNALWTGW